MTEAVTWALLVYTKLKSSGVNKARSVKAKAKASIHKAKVLTHKAKAKA
jgi:hypothetical protein